MGPLSQTAKLLRDEIEKRHKLVRKARVQGIFPFLSDENEIVGLSCVSHCRSAKTYRLINQTEIMEEFISYRERSALSQYPMYRTPRFEITFHESEALAVFSWALDNLYGVKAHPIWMLPHPDLKLEIGKDIPGYSWSRKAHAAYEEYRARNLARIK